MRKDGPEMLRYKHGMIDACNKVIGTELQVMVEVEYAAIHIALIIGYG